jgi:DNA-binding MarR family transcriptional regulator
MVTRATPTRDRSAERSPAGTDDRAAVELGLAVKRFRARMRAETATAEGWTISQLSTLARIIDDGPLTASELAHAEHVRPQSVGELVAALRDGGLIATQPDPGDGRKTLLSATAEGRALRDGVLAARGSWLARAIEAEVGPDERDQLEAAIDILNRLADCDLAAPDTAGWRA